MVQAARENHTAETNAANQIDVFGMTEDAGKQEPDDDGVEIF